MSVRQYVGARYVPRFTGLYNNTQVYEGLDVVDNGSGTSYIARKPVPAGTPLTNTEYWFVYGATSGAILQLQNDVADLQLDMGKAQTDIVALENSRCLEMGSRTFLFLADSYDALGDFVDNVGTAIRCKRYIKRTQSGACFVRHDPDWSQYNYLNILTNIAPLSSDDLAEITDVVIFASVNDAPTDASDMNTAMTALNTWMHANMPNLKKVQILSIGWYSCDPVGQHKVCRNLGYYSLYACRLGWAYIDCSRVMRLCKWNSPVDGYHPTATAGRYIADATINAILTGSCNWSVQAAEFSYTFGAWPAALGTVSLTRPSSGKMTLSASVTSSGNIVGRFTSDILADFTDIPPYNLYGVTLTPETPYANPLPAYGLFDYPIIRNGGTGFWDSAFVEMGTAQNATLYMIGGTNSQAVTPSMRILTNVDKQFIINS